VAKVQAKEAVKKQYEAELRQKQIQWKAAEKDRESAERLRQEKLRGEAIEALAAFESKSRAAVALILTNPDEGARHVAKKILIIQTLGQVLYACSKDDHERAVGVWNKLYKRIREEGDWFDRFLANREKLVTAITQTYPATPKATQEMIQLSTDFRKAIESSPKETGFLIPLKSLRPIWYEQVGSVTSTLTTASADGRPLPEVMVYASLFWRLYSCELVLVEDMELAAAMIAFGDSLQQWEHATDQKPSSAVAQDLRKKANAIHILFKSPVRAAEGR
jgi:hypothetical protein